MFFHLLLIDAAVVVLATAALLSTLWQHRRVVKHWHVLLPGLLSLGASIALVGYPRWTHLLELQRFSLAVVAILAGAVRGRTMKLKSDRVSKVVALHNPADAILVAGVQAAVAGLDMVLDIRAGGLNRFTFTVELVLIVTAAYLLGRSVMLWMRVRRSADVELLRS